MKKITLIFSLLLFFNCNNPAKDSSPAEYKIEALEDTSIENETFSYDMSVTVSNSYIDLVEQKLNDIYDQVYLEQKHKDFSKTLDSTSQLIIRNLPLGDYKTEPEVRNVSQLGQIKVLSDSIDEVKLYYELFVKEFFTRDTITARIKKTLVSIDNESFFDLDVEFILDDQ